MKKSLIFSSTALLTLFCLSLAPCNASETKIFELAGESARQALGMYEWKVDAPNNIGTVDRKSLSAIVENSFSEIEYYRLHYDDYNESSSEIVELDVRDINNDGLYEIIGTCGEKECRWCPPAYFVITKQGDSFNVQFIETAGGSIKYGIIDLNDDGASEIIVGEVLAASNDQASAVQWVDIYSWEGGRYIKSSENYPEYYSGEYIPKLEKRLAKEDEIDVNKLAQDYKWRLKRARTWKENAVSDVTLAIDKAKRTAGMDPMAGFSRAVQWQTSDNPALRRNAAMVFGDIGDDASLYYLEKLSKDRDSVVSGEAKHALKKLKKRSINPGGGRDR